jgi:ATP-binding protein involved in chromosome partitioning
LDFRLQMIARRLEGVRRIILVTSGKGGVGKSVVAATLADYISKKSEVGLLDLDMHGPTLPLLLNHDARLSSQKEGVNPVMAGRIKLVSLGLITEKPLPLKGEVKRDLIIELFSEIEWGKLDYLIVDLPPGTGDEAMTAMRLTLRKSSAILVSTPSPHSLAAVKRMRGLLLNEGVNIIGLVLNMAYILDEKYIVMPFGRYDGQELAREMGVGVIAELPLEPTIASSTPIDFIKLSTEFREGLRSIYRAMENSS